MTILAWIVGGAVVGIVIGRIVNPIMMRRALARELRRGPLYVQTTCARCRRDLGTDASAWYEGELICGACASRLERRLALSLWVALGILTLFALSGVVAPIVALARGEPQWWLGFVIIEGCTAVMAAVFWFSIRSMKWLNRVGRDTHALTLRMRRLLENL